MFTSVTPFHRLSKVYGGQKTGRFHGVFTLLLQRHSSGMALLFSRVIGGLEDERVPRWEWE
eukprot:scaffold251980_cov26-Tisochrysis_lutea.AAC.1